MFLGVRFTTSGLLILLSEMNQGIVRYIGVKWMSWSLKLRAIRLLLFCFVLFLVCCANDKDNINNPHYWTFVKGIAVELKKIVTLLSYPIGDKCQPTYFTGTDSSFFCLSHLLYLFE